MKPVREGFHADNLFHMGCELLVKAPHRSAENDRRFGKNSATNPVLVTLMMKTSMMMSITVSNAVMLIRYPQD